MLTCPMVLALHPRRTGPGFMHKPGAIKRPGFPHKPGQRTVTAPAAATFSRAIHPSAGAMHGPYDPLYLSQRLSTAPCPRKKACIPATPPPLFSMRCALLREPHLSNGPLFSYSCALLLPQLPCFDSHATCPMAFQAPNLKPRVRASCTSPRRKKSRATCTSPQRDWYRNPKSEEGI
jgi:hypothetical protein